MASSAFAIEDTTADMGFGVSSFIPTESETDAHTKSLTSSKRSRIRWIQPRDVLGAAVLGFTLYAPQAYLKDSSTEEVRALNDDFQAKDAVSELVAELDAYRNLENNWDGPGSVAPSENAIREALRFIDLIPDKTISFETMVAADGEVGVCCADERIYADIGFRGDGHITYFVRYADGVAKGHEPFGGSLPRKLVHALTA